MVVDPDQPTVSVVVPTFNNAASLCALLDALAAQVGAPPFEVVVSDDATTDGSLAEARAAAQRSPLPVRIVTSTANTGPAGARNRGWRAASGEAILFTDDDCSPSPGWVAAMAAGLAEADACVGPIVMSGGTPTTIGPFGSYLDIGDDGSFSTGNVAYRRAILERTGGFDEATFAYRRPRGSLHCINGEDCDLGHRARDAGATHTYRPDAVVHHPVTPSNFRHHLRSMRRLEGMVILVGRHPSERDRLGIGRFLRSVDKAVGLSWAALLLTALRPRSRVRWGVVGASAVVYTWKCREARLAPRTLGEAVAMVPLGFVADTYAVSVMARSSWRHRTLLL